MPRRNLIFLIATVVVSLLCFQNARHSRYGRVLVDTMKLVEQRYLEPVTTEKLVEGAIEGMISHLGDQHSSYIPPAEFDDFNSQIDQQFGGVGLEVILDPDSKQLAVGRPLVGSPAYRAGVLAGDKILAVNGKSTKDLSLEDAVKLMRGKLGEAVVLTVLHEEEKEPVDITIVRETIHLDTVVGDVHNPDGSWNFFLDGEDRIGYLRINMFGKNTSAEMHKALAWLVDHDMRGLVLDLRDDPGGLLDAAIAVCNEFVKSGVIVTTRGREKDLIRERYVASGEAKYVDFPIAVLVNHNSASASEIVAACLQDHGRAAIVGERTYGKGTVQEVLELENKRGALKLTTAGYWRPSERNIHRHQDATESDTWGVLPDEGYAVTVKGEELAKLRLARLKRDLRSLNGKNGKSSEPLNDPQLLKALEYLHTKLDK